MGRTGSWPRTWARSCSTPGDPGGTDRAHRRRVPGPADRVRTHGVHRAFLQPVDAPGVAHPGCWPSTRRRPSWAATPGAAADRPRLPGGSLHGTGSGHHCHGLLHRVREFMVIVAKALDLMVTGCSTSGWPWWSPSGHRHHRADPAAEPHPGPAYPGVEHQPEKLVTGRRFHHAWAEARKALHRPEPGPQRVDNLRTASAWPCPSSSILSSV
ncbi:hypothetical protein QJS66_13785 [Kocuria rhizophila]|nr:hypothetical protein QJS66_13785 [Kocuria rhizophila]